MKNGKFLLNPFQMLTPYENVEVLGLEKLHEQPLSTAASFQDGVMLMIGKFIGITRELSDYVRTCRASTCDICESLAKDVHLQEKVFTRFVASSHASPELRNDVIRFTDCIEKVANMLKRVLSRFQDRLQTNSRFHTKQVSEEPL